jgi:hypothetical protein
VLPRFAVSQVKFKQPQLQHLPTRQLRAPGGAPSAFPAHLIGS